MADKNRYIHIRNWDKYQHPDTRRSGRWLPWIKDFTSQIHELDYRALSFADRGLLHSLREMYALNRGDGIEIAQGSLHSLLGQRVRTVQLERLNQAGFIDIHASKTLATCKQPASPELEVETEREIDQQQEQDQEPSIPPSVAKRAPAKNGRKDGWTPEQIDPRTVLGKLAADDIPF